MKIFITTPSFGRHGGIRIIMEWANRLTKWHQVYIHSLKGDRPDWYDLDPAVTITGSSMKGMDCLIITSPHAIDFQEREDRPPKIFIFMQMVEHFFRPDDEVFKRKCWEFYVSPHLMFHGSSWGIDYCRAAGRIGPDCYVPNGVNLEHFPISTAPKDHTTVLVESWEGSNPAKDTDHIAPLVAKRLKAQGFKIIAYGALPLKTLPGVVDEYYYRPSLSRMNQLYQRATILLKATRYDARALAPLEAGTKGTVTARAIVVGDDDLIDGWNCERCEYDVDQLYRCAMRILSDPEHRERLAKNMRDHILDNIRWDNIMLRINSILCQK